MSRPKIIAISGSLRKSSASTAILHTLSEAVADRADFEVYSIADVPLYNADLDGEHAPQGVRDLKSAIDAADGVVFATPEYNYGISGVLKNAIDWASRPAYASVLKGKPVLNITSSPGATGGVRAQLQLRETLAATLSRVIARPEVIISGVYGKIEGGRLTDQASVEFAVAAVDDLLAEVALVSPGVQ